MENYVWLFLNKEKKRLTYAHIGSLVFHGLAVTVIASASVFLPITGAERSDCIWFDMVSLPSAEKTPCRAGARQYIPPEGKPHRTDPSLPGKEEAMMELPGHAPSTAHYGVAAHDASSHRRSLSTEQEREGSPAGNAEKGGVQERSTHKAGDVPEKKMPSAIHARKSPTAPPVRRTAENPPSIKEGPAIPSLRGDLKLVISGAENLKVTVIYKYFPKGRRNRPLSKGESHGHKIVPIVARTRDNGREAVIQSANEGIYVFIVEPVGQKTVNAAFTIKTFEGSNSGKTKTVTGRSIASRTVVAKVLMPEGILWDDDAAFSGTIQDSGSMTKFDTATGLVWKEYSE